MHFPMKIQPIDYHLLEEPTRFEPVKPVVKSRLKRLFERQFLRNSAAEEPVHFNKDVYSGGGSGSAAAEFEPSSECLAKMVQNFIEENNIEKQSGGAIKCCCNRCNYVNGNCNSSFEDELDSYGIFGDSNLASSAEACEILKSLVPCAGVNERNLLADTAQIVEKNKLCKRKGDLCRKIVTDGLLALGYDASICKSRWDKSPSYPAGEYEYIDVVIYGERLIVDVDFRSEFEIARSTKMYKSMLQTLPYIFVGKADRLKKIIGIVTEAAKQSLKKKGMHIPPWRKAEYIKAKWLSPHPRAAATASESNESSSKTQKSRSLEQSESEFGEKNSVDDNNESESVFVLSESSESEEEGEKLKVVKNWKPPEIKPSSLARTVTGLASVIEDHQP